LIDLKEIKNKIAKKENVYFLIIIFLIFSIDRYSKIKIINNFSGTSFYLNDFLNLNLLWNTGIGFGILSSTTGYIYNSISLLIGLIVIFLLLFSLRSDNFDKVIFAMIIGGALGNFYDRLVFKAVPDFIDLHYGSLHWFTFNIADIFITIGIIGYILKGIFIKN